jgi:uncharacterized protein (DUF58 family)
VESRELLSKITALPLIAGGLAEDLLAGNFSSIFKGQGIEVDEVRHYERGDEVRSIDWNVSARFGTPFVKMYREERDLTVFLVLDSSASMGSAGASARVPYEQGILAAALIAFSAEQAGQRVGAVFFDREISRVFPPRKGRAQVMAILTGALRHGAKGRGSSLGAALLGAGRLLKRRSLVVVVSDFLALNWEKELGALCRKHDVIALRVGLPPDEEMPGLGLITLEDPESGRTLQGTTNFAPFRAAWAEWKGERARSWRVVCRRSGVASLDLSATEDIPAALIRFFGGRRRL